MDIYLLKTLIAVAKHESVTKASEEVFLTQPAITKQIKVLEREYGIELFERKNNRFVLTQDGSVLLDYAYRIVSLYNESIDKINEIQGKPTGTLTMGVNLTLGIYVLPQLLKLFYEVYPDLKIEMILDNTDHIVKSVKRGEVNFGFVGLNIEDSLISNHRCYQGRMKVVMGPGLADDKKTLGWKELTALPFIGRERGSDIRETYEQWLKEKGIRITPKMELNNTEAIKMCVQEGIGFSFLPWCTVQQEVTHGLLRVVSVPYFDVPQNYYICHYNDKRFSRQERIFLEFLFDQIESKGILSTVPDIVLP